MVRSWGHSRRAKQKNLPVRCWKGILQSLARCTRQKMDTYEIPVNYQKLVSNFLTSVKLENLFWVKLGNIRLSSRRINTELPQGYVLLYTMYWYPYNAGDRNCPICRWDHHGQREEPQLHIQTSATRNGPGCVMDQKEGNKNQRSSTTRKEKKFKRVTYNKNQLNGSRN